MLQCESKDGHAPEAASTEAPAESASADAAVENGSAPPVQEPFQQVATNMMNMGPGGFPIGWNGTPMNPFMGNGMFNFSNPMGKLKIQIFYE